MPQSRSGGFEEHNLLTLPEIEPRTVHLIAKSLHRQCAVCTTEYYISYSYTVLFYGIPF
jgi:hypothetical protein